MIKSKRTFVKTGSKSYRWYVDKGYIFKCGDIIDISIDDITEYSSAIVDVECQMCFMINKKKFCDYKYAINKSRDGKYYCKGCSHVNTKMTNIEKYGTVCPLQNSEVLNKSKQTLIKVYGVDNISKSESLKEERSNLMKEKTKEYNDIIYNKYGCNVSNIDFIKEKKRITCLKNWGVENPMQNPLLFEKSQISGKKIKMHQCGLFYRGTYEKDFLDYCLNKNIEVEKGLTIQFRYKNKIRFYHSDFYIREKNLIIEVKSSYYYDKYKELNDTKQIETIKYGYNHIFVIDKDYTHISLSLFSS